MEEILRKALDRERKARKEAESVIEQKSREIYEANQSLKDLNENLETRIKERTQEVELSKEIILQAKEEAEAATDAKSTFLSTMSHEIRTPLNGIIGLTDLSIGLCKDPALGKLLSNIKISADNLLGIINDILDFSKIEAGKITFEKAPFELDELLKSLSYSFQYKAEEKGLLFKTILDPAILNLIVGDRVKLNQILTNLTGNALKFTSSGTIHVEASAARMEGKVTWLKFSVRDTGIGIPPDRLESVFESFTQSDATTTRKFGGTGLGLSISRNLVELQGGSIGVQSKEGKGTSFWFILPFEIPTEKEKRAYFSKSQTQRFVEFNKELVLLAEDNKINQFVAASALKNWGLEVDIANNGAEAVAMLASKTYTLVLMDLQMPVKDGLEATQEIRKGLVRGCDPEIPIIAITANAFKETKELVGSMGMNGFTTKPIIQQELNAILSTFIKSKKNEEHE